METEIYKKRDEYFWPAYGKHRKKQTGRLHRMMEHRNDLPCFVTGIKKDFFIFDLFLVYITETM